MPIISSIMAEIKNQRYTERCFLNIDLPTDVVNHKVNFILAPLSLFDVEFLTWPCIQHSFSGFLDWLTSKVGDHCLGEVLEIRSAPKHFLRWYQNRVGKIQLQSNYIIMLSFSASFWMCWEKLF